MPIPNIISHSQTTIFSAALCIKDHSSAKSLEVLWLLSREHVGTTLTRVPELSCRDMGSTYRGKTLVLVLHCKNYIFIWFSLIAIDLIALVLPAFGCCTLLLLVPKMVLTLCNLHWWCFSCHQLAQRPHLHLQWASPATCTGGVFLVPTNTFTIICTPCTATCTAAGCGYSASCKIP